MSKKEKRAVLIGAGDLAGECIEVEKEDFIIALDGGLVFCVENDIKPDYIMGDFDSLPEEKNSLLEEYPEDRILRLPKEKDDTDMLAAIKFAMEKGITDFIIYGGLGGRLSHTVANLQCLLYLKERDCRGVLFGKDTKAFLLKDERFIFSASDSGYLSVFAYSEKAEGVTLKGLKYELEEVTLANSFPLGVSNAFIGKEAVVCVKKGVLLLVMDK